MVIVNMNRKEEIVNKVRRDGRCLACLRQLKWATLDKACTLCKGLYIYQGAIFLDENPPKAGENS